MESFKNPHFSEFLGFFFQSYPIIVSICECKKSHKEGKVQTI